MLILDRAMEAFGGYASRAELVGFGVPDEWVRLTVWYGWTLVRIRRGWFARPGEREDVIRAWRVGGRLTCISAAAFHDGCEPTPVLHVEVPANAGRLRDPDDPRRRLGPDAAVVVHWTRHPGPGDRHAVTAAHAEAVAAACGVHSAGVRSG
ncbi:MAG TPA: hypothetical protein VGM70_08330 [Pseudolysinimonas sp.]|jgi:hypothetical protein